MSYYATQSTTYKWSAPVYCIQVVHSHHCYFSCLFLNAGNTTVVVAVVLPLAVIIVLAAALLAYRCKGCAQWRNTMLYEVACNTPVGKGVLPRWNSPTKLKNVDLASLEHLQIARNRLHNMQPIGEGNFGKVYMAEAEGIGLDRKERTLVAIKALKDTDCPEARRKFYQEMKTMAELSHANLLRLLAVCTKKQPAYLITEFMNEVRGGLRFK